MTRSDVTRFWVNSLLFLFANWLDVVQTAIVFTRLTPGAVTEMNGAYLHFGWSVAMFVKFAWMILWVVFAWSLMRFPWVSRCFLQAGTIYLAWTLIHNSGVILASLPNIWKGV